MPEAWARDRRGLDIPPETSIERGSSWLTAAFRPVLRTEKDHDSSQKTLARTGFEDRDLAVLVGLRSRCHCLANHRWRKVKGG